MRCDLLQSIDILSMRHDGSLLSQFLAILSDPISARGQSVNNALPLNHACAGRPLVPL